MIDMNQSVLVLYTTATCNLNCSYCYIDKNPALQEIDTILDNSFKDDYYFNFAKEIFKNPLQLQEIQFWGGEPTLRLDRVYNLIPKFINYYPNLSTFMMSTNLTHDKWIEQYFGFLDVLGKFSEKKFTFKLQLSLDGPTYLNDKNRGKGTTEKFSKNFVKFISLIEDTLKKYQNITVEAFFKPTLDAVSIRYLQNKENIIQYYQFFELYKDIAQKVKVPNFRFTISIPNTACPSPHTVEDGKLFANLVKLTREIEIENEQHKYFKYYQKITPFGQDLPYQDGQIHWNSVGACGTGKFVLGLLPNKMLSGCHSGFVELISDYKRYCLETQDKERTISANTFISEGMSRHPLVFPVSELENYYKKIDCFYNTDYTQKVNSVNFIMFLAKNGQIDSKYKDFHTAYVASNYLLNRVPYCIRDNIAMTGSIALPPIGLYKLFLNGAMDYFIKDKEKK